LYPPTPHPQKNNKKKCGQTLHGQNRPTELLLAVCESVIIITEREQRIQIIIMHTNKQGLKGLCESYRVLVDQVTLIHCKMFQNCMKEWYIKSL
jgi:hypothetical protein